MKKLKLGFIGGGINSAVGNAHLIASQMDNRWDIVAGCFSKNEEINKKTSELWNIKNVYSNWEELLEKEKNNLDAISIVTPINLHFEMVKKALELGYSVICEKTLTSNYIEAEIIAKLTEEKKSFLSVINNYTGYPMLRELKEMIIDNKLGKIKHIEAEMPQESFIKYNEDGNIPKPQEWRLSDNEIPTIYLDLGIHLYNIVEFLTNLKPVEVCAIHSSNGFFKNIIDNVSCLINFNDDVTGHFWFTKSALGNRNGLKIRIFGEQGSAEWIQIDAENIKFSNNYGKVEIIDRASPNLKIANQPRYNRFKSGHPAGFIEAFANYYYDLAEGLIKFQNTGVFDNKYLISSISAKNGMKFLDAITKSSNSKKWEKINYVEVNNVKN